jgi:hypothetical protein
MASRDSGRAFGQRSGSGAGSSCGGAVMRYWDATATRSWTLVPPTRDNQLISFFSIASEH